MKNYVVGILSMFDNDLKLFKVSAESPYEAVKKGMIDFCEGSAAKESEIEWQNSPDYPKDMESMVYAYEDVPFDVIEVD